MIDRLYAVLCQALVPGAALSGAVFIHLVAALIVTILKAQLTLKTYPCAYRPAVS